MSQEVLQELPTVGVLGLGNLGAAIALRLVDAGLDVAGADTDEERSDALASQGVRVGIDAVFQSDVICVVTPDEESLRDSLAARMDWAPRCVVLCATVQPEAAVSLAEVLEMRGSQLVEAPVSGGALAARRGELSVMVSGPATGVRAAEPILAALANKRFDLGATGAASAVKLVNQLVLFATLGAVLEGQALAQSYGVSGDDLVEALRASTADSWAIQHLPFFVGLVRDYDEAKVPSANRPWRKDLAAFVAAAREGSTSAELASVLSSSLGDQLEAYARASAGVTQ